MLFCNGLSGLYGYMPFEEEWRFGYSLTAAFKSDPPKPPQQILRLYDGPVATTFQKLAEVCTSAVPAEPCLPCLCLRREWKHIWATTARN